MPCSFWGKVAAVLRHVLVRIRNRKDTSQHHLDVLANLSTSVCRMACEFDKPPFSFEQVAVMLSDLGVVSHKNLNVLFGVVTSLRDHLSAKVAASSQADFRKKLSEDLADHASFAHMLCKPSPPRLPTLVSSWKASAPALTNGTRFGKASLTSLRPCHQFLLPSCLSLANSSTKTFRIPLYTYIGRLVIPIQGRRLPVPTSGR